MVIYFNVGEIGILSLWIRDWSIAINPFVCGVCKRLRAYGFEASS